MKISEIPTPAVIVMIDAMQNNIKKMSETANKYGVKLRPHIKSHKISRIAHMQIEAGAIGITCAKVSEAEVMAYSGINDILIAYPIIQQYQINKALELNSKAKMTLAFDSIFGAEMINTASKDRELITDLYMIIDSGLNRDGVTPGDQALALARSIQKFNNIKLKGIMTHEGHAYMAKNIEELFLIGNDVLEKMVSTANLLRLNEIPIDEVSTGSTPTTVKGIFRDGITEWRPGAYLFNDINMYYLDTPMEECSLSILSTVVSHPTPNRYIIDAGSKTLSSDRSIKHEGFGYIKQVPNAIIERLSEEHGIVTAEDEDMTLGQRIEIMPNHVCTVVNLIDKIYAVRNDNVVDEWNVDARGKIV